MAAIITDEKERVYPLRKPEGFVPKLPRWTLKLPDGLKELAVIYVGVQRHDESVNTQIVTSAIDGWTKTCPYPPIIVDTFEVISGRDQPGTLVWACYWTNKDEALQSERHLNLKKIHSSSDGASSNGNPKSRIGLWLETFSPDLTRFETNYSGQDYKPGLAQLEGTEQIEHTMTGYWGAARDRMYASAYDTFDGEEANDATSESDPKPTSSQQPQISNNKEEKDEEQYTHIQGTNRKTIAHIRSGQFWQNCEETERQAYESDLEPHLINGLKDIHAHPDELGDFGLRFLRNISSPLASSDESHQREKRKETCGAGFFRSLKDLENWAKNCPSHHRIYGGSMNHRRRFGSAGKMRTWHEICVLKPGEARWEYLNCVDGTGIVGFQ